MKYIWYRSWSIEHKKFHYFYNGIYYKNFDDFVFNLKELENDYKSRFWWSNADALVNISKTIFEGDIISFDNSAIGGKKVVGEVIFNEDNTLGYLGWALWNNGFIPCDFLGDIEILGNIHQNPELL